MNSTTPDHAGEEDRVRIVKQIAMLASPFVLLGTTAAAALTLAPPPHGAASDINASWLQACFLANHRR